MGGYAVYVWTAFAVTVLVLGAVMLSPALRHRQLKSDLVRQQHRQQHQDHGEG